MSFIRVLVTEHIAVVLVLAAWRRHQLPTSTLPMDAPGAWVEWRIRLDGNMTIVSHFDAFGGRKNILENGRFAASRPTEDDRSCMLIQKRQGQRNSIRWRLRRISNGCNPFGRFLQ